MQVDYVKPDPLNISDLQTNIIFRIYYTGQVDYNGANHALEADSGSADQQFSRVFQPELSLPRSQEPTT